MSSGSWELVSRKKDKTDKSNKLTKAEKKKFMETAPKVEEIPLNQMKTLYDNLDGNKENKKPNKVQKKEHKTKENEEKKKQQKQQQQQTQKKKQELKEKLPKSVEDALNAINTHEFNGLLTEAQFKYPDVPWRWLKEFDTYLNAKIPINKEDATFSNKPKDYPLNLVPKDISSMLEQAAEIAGPQAVQVFYENSLTEMANDMIKGIPVVGHKIILQLLAHLYPKIIVASIPKLISTRNSYKNRKDVCLSLLWVWSQVGKKDLLAGLKIWHRVMLPLLDTKRYTSYIIQILNDLVFDHDNVCDIGFDLYLNIIKDTYQNFDPHSIQPLLWKEINIDIDQLRLILFRNKNINFTELFSVLMGKLSEDSSLLYKHELLKVLIDCLIKEPACFTVWASLYDGPYLYQTALLLSEIDENISDLQKRFKSKNFKEMLEVIQNKNKKWTKSYKDRAFQCKKRSQVLLEKMASSKRRSSQWRFASLLLLLLIGVLVAYDTQKHGSFEASKVGRFLKTTGISRYVEKTRAILQSYWSASHKAIKDSSPEYYKLVVDTCTPYVKLASDFCLVMKNISIRLYNNSALYIGEKIPVVLDTIEHYAPGAIDQVKSHSLQGLEFAKKSFILIAEKVIEHSSATVQWLEKNVFVGKLSPDNLRNYAIWAFDVTQSYATQTYDWVYEKMQTLSKVP